MPNHNEWRLRQAARIMRDVRREIKIHAFKGRLTMPTAPIHPLRALSDIYEMLKKDKRTTEPFSPELVVREIRRLLEEGQKWNLN